MNNLRVARVSQLIFSWFNCICGVAFDTFYVEPCDI